MKHALLVVSTLLVVAVLCAFTMQQVKTVRSLEQVGIPADMVRQSILYSFTSNYLSYPNISALKKIATGQRAEAVREIYAFARSYVQTPEFKKAYDQWRMGLKPEAPEKPKPMAEQRKEQKAQLAASIKETETNMKSMPAETRAMMKDAMEMMKQQLKEYDNPDNPMFSKDMEEMQLQMYNSSMEEHKRKVAEWEADYPTDPKPTIRKWLTKFLEVSKDVDFNAALKPGEGGKMVFVNPEYESRPAEWKMCYRTGKDAVMAARTSAQQWLQELQ